MIGKLILIISDIVRVQITVLIVKDRIDIVISQSCPVEPITQVVAGRSFRKQHGGAGNVPVSSILQVYYGSAGFKIINIRHPDTASEIGSASCRERVCTYVSITLDAVALKKKKNK